MTSREAAWKAITQEPFYVAGVKLKPLNLGAVYLLTEIGAETPLNAKELVVSISIANARKHNKACEIWAGWIEKPTWMYWRWIRVVWIVRRHFEKVRNAWFEYFEHSTSHPPMSGGFVQSHGQGILWTMRASLIGKGGYSQSEIWDVPFQQALLDFAYYNGIDVWDEKKQAGLEALKKEGQNG